MSSGQREVERQSALLAALFVQGAAGAANSGDAGNAEQASGGAGLAERGERLRRGLAAYRGNAAGMAERALAAAYPTLAARLGEAETAALARALWQASPPRRGDLAQWGRDLPEFIEAQDGLEERFLLADCARLDAAVQRCESAADAELERDSLALLAEQPPERLRLRLLPCVQLLSRAWPNGAPAVVARRGWRGVAQAVDAAGFAWMQALLEGCSLAGALARAGPGFDFEAWLLQALQQQWLWKAEAATAAAA